MAKAYDPFDFSDQQPARQQRAYDPFDFSNEGSVAGDLGASVLGGGNSLVSIVGGLYGLATGDMDNSVYEWAQENRTSIDAMKSDDLRMRERRLQESIASADGFVDQAAAAVWGTVSDPYLMLNMVAEQLPLLVATGGSGIAASAGAKALGAGTKAAVRAGTSGAAVAGGAMNAADVGSGAYEQQMSLPDNIWNANEEFLNRSLDVGAEEAKKEISLRNARAAAAAAGAVSGLTTFLPGTIEKTIVGDVGIAKGGLLKGIGFGIAGEGAQEVIEEGGGQFASNLATRNVDPNQDVLEGVGGAAGQALALGGAIGGVGGGIGSQLRTDYDPFAGKEPSQVLAELQARAATLNARIEDGLAPDFAEAQRAALMQDATQASLAFPEFSFDLGAILDPISTAAKAGQAEARAQGQDGLGQAANAAARVAQTASQTRTVETPNSRTVIETDSPQAALTPGVDLIGSLRVSLNKAIITARREQRALGDTDPKQTQELEDDIARLQLGLSRLQEARRYEEEGNSVAIPGILSQVRDIAERPILSTEFGRRRAFNYINVLEGELMPRIDETIALFQQGGVLPQTERPALRAPADFEVNPDGAARRPRSTTQEQVFPDISARGDLIEDQSIIYGQEPSPEPPAPAPQPTMDFAIDARGNVARTPNEVATRRNIPTTPLLEMDVEDRPSTQVLRKKNGDSYPTRQSASVALARVKRSNLDYNWNVIEDGSGFALEGRLPEGLPPREVDIQSIRETVRPKPYPESYTEEEVARLESRDLGSMEATSQIDRERDEFSLDSGAATISGASDSMQTEQKGSLFDAPVEQAPAVESTRDPSLPNATPILERVTTLLEKDSLSSADLDSAAKAMGVAKKRKGENLVARKSRLIQTLSSLMELNESALKIKAGGLTVAQRKDLAARTGTKVRGGKQQIGDKLLDRLQGLQTGLEDAQARKVTREKLRDLRNAGQPISVADSDSLYQEYERSGSYVYTQGDRDVAVELGHEFLLPEGQRENEQAYLDNEAFINDPKGYLEERIDLDSDAYKAFLESIVAFRSADIAVRGVNSRAEFEAFGLGVPATELNISDLANEIRETEAYQSRVIEVEAELREKNASMTPDERVWNSNIGQSFKFLTTGEIIKTPDPQSPRFTEYSVTVLPEYDLPPDIESRVLGPSTASSIANNLREIARFNDAMPDFGASNQSSADADNAFQQELDELEDGFDGLDDEVSFSPKRINGITDINQAREDRALNEFRSDFMGRVKERAVEVQALAVQMKEDGVFDGLEVGDTYTTTNKVGGRKFRNRVLGFGATKVGPADRKSISDIPTISEEDIYQNSEGKDYKGVVYTEVITEDGETYKSTANMHLLRSYGYQKMGGLKSADEVKLAPKAAREGNKHGVSREYTVESRGSVSGKPAITKAINTKNGEKVLSGLRALEERHPDPLGSKASWLKFERELLGDNETPVAPTGIINLYNNMDAWVEKHSSLTPAQLEAAGEGFELVDEMQAAYASGDASVDTTGKLMLWGMLSRMLSAHPHESAFLDAAVSSKLSEFIGRAVDRPWTESDVSEYLDWAATAIPDYAPGKQGTSNLNDFGKIFLNKLSQRQPEGISGLEKLHNLVADQNVPTKDVRAAYYSLGDGLGIQNKVLSFVLLMTGRKDVVVLDRIQINSMWDANKFGKLIYDDVAPLFEGAHGLARYEALERSLLNRIDDLYDGVGRAEDASVGRYHWESWVRDSGQVVSHPTVKGMINEARSNKSPEESYSDLGAPEGRFHTYAFGSVYARDDSGAPYVLYKDSGGKHFKFGLKDFKDFLSEAKKPKNGVIPKGFSVKSFKDKGYPWFESEDVNREKLDTLIRAFSEGEGTTEEIILGTSAASEAGGVGRTEEPSLSRRERPDAEEPGSGRLEAGLDEEPRFSRRRGLEETSQSTPMDTALRRIREVIAEQEGRTARDADITPVMLDAIPEQRRTSAEFALEAARVFQKADKVSFVKLGEGVEGFNGATVYGQIVIDEASESPYHIVLGHELTHVLKLDHPDLYSQLESFIMPRATATEESAELHGMDAGNPRAREEYVSDVVGNRFGEREFWAQMAESNPKGFRRIAQIARSLMERLANHFRLKSTKTGDDVKDLNNIRAEIARVMSQYRDRETGSGNPIPEVYIPLFRKKARVSLSPKPDRDGVQQVDDPGRRAALGKIAKAAVVGAAGVQTGSYYLGAFSDSGLVRGKAKPISDFVDRKLPQESLDALLNNDLIAAIDAATEGASLDVLELASTIKRLLPESDTYNTDVVGGTWNVAGQLTLGNNGTKPSLLMYPESTDQGQTATLLHEALHLVIAARYRSLSISGERNFEALDMDQPEARVALDQWIDLWKEFQQTINPNRFVGQKERDLVEAAPFAEQIAYGDPDEFFARALTDPEFQSRLHGIDYRGKTLWERFKDWVKTYLFKPNTGVQPTFLDATLTAAHDIFQSADFDRPDMAFSEAVNESYAASRRRGSDTQNEVMENRIPNKEPTPFQKENERIREKNVTLVEKIKQKARRELTPGGLLPKAVFDEKITRDNQLASVEFDTIYYVKQLEKAVVNTMGGSIDVLPADQKARLNEALAGKLDDSLPEPVKKAVIGMRESIDGLSKQYIEILDRQSGELLSQFSGPQRELLDAYMMAAESGDKREANAILDEAKEQFRESAEAEGLSQDLRKPIQDIQKVMSQLSLLNIIRSNTGTYVNRSYRAFDDSNWFENVPDSVLNSARQYLSTRMQESGMDPDRVTERVEVVLNDILKEGTAYGSIESFIKESKLGAKDLSILQKRKEIAPEIRALLGEYEDPRVNYAKTTTKMARLIHNTRLLDKIKEIGMGDFLFTEDNRPANTTQIAVEGNKTLEPLNGLYAPREVAQAFSDIGKVRDFIQFPEVIVRINGGVKFGKTVLAPTTQFRNFMSAAFFAMANGHWDLRKTQKSLSVMREYFTRDGDTGKLAYLRRLKELGVVYDTPFAGEMMRLLEETKLFDGERAEMNPLQGAVKDLATVAQRMYQFGDDFWKIVGYENERANLVGTGMSETEAEVEAANRIRNTYPTYSLVGNFVNALRRFPFAGTFVSFPAEIIRTQYNMIKIAAEDMKTPGRRAMGIKRLTGMSMAAAMPYAVQSLTKEMFDVSDDEEEAVRLMAPYWSENSNLLFMGRNNKQQLEFLDVSFMDPYNYFKRPINAALRDQPWEESFLSGAKDMIRPFFGTDIFAGALIETYNNKKATGGRIYNESDSLERQYADMAGHISKAVEPGIIGNARRIYKAAAAPITPYGKVYTLEDEAAAFFGFRTTTFDPKAALKFRSYEIKERRNEASSQLRKVLSNPNLVGDEGVEEAIERSLNMRQRTFDEALRLISASKSAGLTDLQVIENLRGANFGRLDIGYLMKGEVPPMVVSPATVKRQYRSAFRVLGQDKAEQLLERYGIAQEILAEQFNQ